MAPHKTSELEGALLDAAVALAEGSPFVGRFAPSTVWDDGGPIIDRERIATYRAHVDSEEWTACVGGFESKSGGIEGPGDGRSAWDWEVGATPLIAAMRAYVASKLGDEVELP